MKKILGISISLLIMGLIMTGCGQAPTVQNIDNSNYFAKNQAKTDVAKAIQRGASRKGWRTKAVSDGLIEANINVRGKYFVAVNINYDEKGYKISYNKTRNLKYNKADNTIHGSYNKWVNYLSQSIDYELQTIGMDVPQAVVVNPVVIGRHPYAAPQVVVVQNAQQKEVVAKAKGKDIDLKGKTIYIKSTVPYAPQSRVQANIKQECTLQTAVAKDIVSAAESLGLNVVIKNKIKPNELELKVQIEGAVSAGNAMMGHSKYVSISGVIVKGKTQYYAFDAARLSGGGYFGAYRSSCSVLGGISRRLGKDTAGWLMEPYHNAELGDTQLIRR